MGSTAWEKIQGKAGLAVSPYSGSLVAPELEQPPNLAGMIVGRELRLSDIARLEPILASLQL